MANVYLQVDIKTADMDGSLGVNGGGKAGGQIRQGRLGILALQRLTLATQ